MINQEITYSQVRANLATILDSVSENREIVKITRRNGADVALIAADELSSLLESVYLLRSPANAKRLFSAMEWAKSDAAIPQSLEQLRQELEIES
ncbi:type II toxin-antitoxin system Phd/YefM family antitoxin [Chamaesiphon sp. VAR_48_metabat_135_sub]|uniref:type II toxin-antitoxin system Phd/YefM family antitoxin n=1 Tax=Chamaesiphon sp. VAR_48_metabat_135_sub TaxID=2964699 RepID=UPI00286A07D8|nr:type II toxin-antitoxin system Phd/YefM family antitoxin [Chamaesiphon sp. VAR_48_metabat_135_sub]